MSQGAEALIEKDGDYIIKRRISKKYRLKTIDEFLRKRRTKTEIKNMQKAARLGIAVPRIISYDKYTITMEYINGKKLKDVLDEMSVKQQNRVLKLIGLYVSNLHNADIIHGDLTTSNMIISGDLLYFIDFGLSFYSSKIEDKAVDLHLLRQALFSSHINPDNKWTKILKVYESENHEGKKTINRLKIIEKRGRYVKR